MVAVRSHSCGEYVVGCDLAARPQRDGPEVKHGHPTLMRNGRRGFEVLVGKYRDEKSNRN